MKGGGAQGMGRLCTGGTSAGGTKSRGVCVGGGRAARIYCTVLCLDLDREAMQQFRAAACPGLGHPRSPGARLTSIQSHAWPWTVD